MPFKKPSLQEIHDRILTDMARELNDGKPIPDKSHYKIWAAIQAAQSYGLYQYLEWISKQAMIDTCDSETRERIASQKGIFRKDKSQARGQIKITGNDGMILPKGTVIVRSRDGMRYLTSAHALIVKGEAAVSCICETPGVIGNSKADDSFVMSNTLAGIDSNVSMMGVGMTGGSDGESDASLIARYLDRVRHEPNGGTLDDYRIWVEKIPGVSRAWIYSNINTELIPVGEVIIYFITGDIHQPIPDDTLMSYVCNQIRAKAPLTAVVKVFKLSESVVDIAIKIDPDQTDIKQNADLRLKELFLNKADPGSRVLLSQIYSKIGEDKRIKRFEVEFSTGLGITKEVPPFTLPTFQGAKWKPF